MQSWIKSEMHNGGNSHIKLDNIGYGKRVLGDTGGETINLFVLSKETPNATIGLVPISLPGQVKVEP